MITNQNTLYIYSDGSSYSKPRRGGIGIRFVHLNNDGLDEIIQDFHFSGYKGATNNQMELQACIEALKKSFDLEVLHKLTRIIIHTDSMYVVQGIEKAKYDWVRNHWRNHYGRPIANAIQWKELIKLMQKVKKRVDFIWVKGHAKNQHNKAVDKLAKESAQKAKNGGLPYVEVRRKKSSEIVFPSSVTMAGQKIIIRIITSEYLKLQKVWKYKYEVMSPKSKYFQKIDIIYYDKVLRTTHSYLVSLNRNQNYPMISKVVCEIEK